MMYVHARFSALHEKSTARASRVPLPRMRSISDSIAAFVAGSASRALRSARGSRARLLKVLVYLNQLVFESQFVSVA